MESEVDPYAEQRYRDGLDCATKATQYDQMGQYSCALTFYSEAVEALTQASQMAPLFSPILSRVEEYGRRAEELRVSLNSGSSLRAQERSVSQTTARDKHNIRQLEYLLEVALLDDEKKRYGQAEKLYSSAIELALRAQRMMVSENDRLKVKMITEQAIDRLEQVKKLQSQAPLFKALDDLHSLPVPPKHIPAEGEGGRSSSRQLGKPLGRPIPLTSFLEADPNKPISFSAFSTDSSSPSVSHAKPSSTTTRSLSPSPVRRAKENLSETERKILRQNSKINDIVFLPWNDLDVAELRIVSPIPMEFKDPAGLPALAEKQKARLKGWMRPTELCEDPRMVYLISSFTIKQTLIGDCSFVASLAVCADYERKFRTRLITRVIHPQNRHGDPIINPNGQYLICLNLNGCKRKVVIDDRLPVGQYNELLCSYSSNDNEFWVSLIEKAYMKVMGGYDFPGSSSNIDLHALTGWIPERISLKECSDHLYKKIETTLRKGMALITVATGPMSEAQAERAGLVQTHAYAVLNVVHIKGHKLLQLKNPWSHQRWKGNFSEHDKVNWTPELRRALNFDQTQALQVDNGVFWIDWKSVCTFYDVLYINWKPDIFKYKHTVHDYWKPSAVEKDVYNISNNPQYTLQVNCCSTSATVWILLSRHITTKSDFAHNEKFITLHIASSNGRRLYLPPDRYTVMGVKINTPHYLAKLENLPAGTHTYTVVVSQLDSLSTIYYSIRVYSSCQFVFSPVPNMYPHMQELRGDWKAGKGMPKFRLNLSSASHVLLQLRGPRKYFVWLEMKSESPTANFKQDSGPSRPGFNIVEACGVASGSYIITARTYNDQDEGPFFISTSSDHVFCFERLHP